MSQRTIVDEPMPEASLTSKRVKEPKEEGKEKLEKKKEKEADNTTEFDSIIEHLKVILEDLKSSNLTNIQEILEMYLTMDVQSAVGTMVPMVGLTKPEGSMPINTKKFDKERKKVIDQNICLRGFHKELINEGFYSQFLNKVMLFRSTPEQPLP